MGERESGQKEITNMKRRKNNSITEYVLRVVGLGDAVVDVMGLDIVDARGDDNVVAGVVERGEDAKCLLVSVTGVEPLYLGRCGERDGLRV